MYTCTTPQNSESRFCILNQDQVLTMNTIIKKEEEDYNNTNTILSMQEELGSLVQQRNLRFDSLLQDVKEYLDIFVDVEDFQLESTSLSNADIETLVIQARFEFKKWGLSVVQSLGDFLKKQSVQHTFPDSYLIQLVESTKQKIFNSYKQLKRHLNEAIISTKVLIKEEPIIKKEEEGQYHLREKRVLKKSKFPKKAKIILKAWFHTNLNDPYPSHEEKIYLAKEGGITIRQLDSWLTNTRGRKWKRKQSETNFGMEVESIFLSKNNEL